MTQESLEQRARKLPRSKGRRHRSKAVHPKRPGIEDRLAQDHLIRRHECLRVVDRVEAPRQVEMCRRALAEIRGDLAPVELHDLPRRIADRRDDRAAKVLVPAPLAQDSEGLQAAPSRRVKAPAADPEPQRPVRKADSKVFDQRTLGRVRIHQASFGQISQRPRLRCEPRVVEVRHPRQRFRVRSLQQTAELVLRKRLRRRGLLEQTRQKLPSQALHRRPKLQALLPHPPIDHRSLRPTPEAVEDVAGWVDEEAWIVVAVVEGTAAAEVLAHLVELETRELRHGDLAFEPLQGRVWDPHPRSSVLSISVNTIICYISNRGNSTNVERRQRDS